jgi:uncharacterized delta-60 repeat protein
LTAVWAGVAQARTGSLDRGFGDGGRIMLGGGPGYPGMEVGGDGSITVFSPERDGPQLRRFLPNGRLDPSFGVGGGQVLARSIDGSPQELNSMELDSQGRIIIFGSAYPPGRPEIGQSSGFATSNVPVSRAVVMRLLPDGQLDPSFGVGGRVVDDFGLRGVGELGTEPTTVAWYGVVDSADRPVFPVAVADGYSPCHGHSFGAHRPVAAVRLTTSGALDDSFGGGDGTSLLPYLNDLSGFAVDANDRLLVAGDADNNPCRSSQVLVGFDAAGTQVAEVGKGRRLFRGATFEYLTPAGDLIMRCGYPTAEVARVSPLGVLDRTFGDNGFAPVGLPRGGNRWLRPVASDSEGRILLLGSYSRPTKSHGKRAFILVERLLSDGRPDRSFGKNGRLSVPIPGVGAPLDYSEGALDPQGRLVVLSSILEDRGYGYNVKGFLVRLRLDS